MEEALNKQNKERNKKEADYYTFITSETEVENILKEIEFVFATHTDREVAEKIVLEKWADKMTSALERSTQALEKWLTGLKKTD